MQINNCTYSGFACFENKVWYITQNDNLLMEMDIITHELECLGKIPNTDAILSYRKVFYRKGVLYLIPYNAQDICKYELKSGKFSFLDILRKYSSKYKYLFGIIEFGNEIILYGLQTEIYRVDLDSYKVKVYQVRNKGESCFWQDGIIYEGKLILPFNKQIMLAVVDLNQNDTQYVQMDVEVSNVILQMFFYEKQNLYYVIIDSMWRIHVININIKDLTVISHNVYRNLVNDRVTHQNVPFQCGFIQNEKIILLPARQTETCVIDLKLNECINAKLLPVIDGNTALSQNNYPFNYFNIVYVKSEKLFFSINWEMEKMITIDSDTLDVQEYDIAYKEISAKQYAQTINQIVHCSNILYEKDHFMDLEDYIELLSIEK